MAYETGERLRCNDCGAEIEFIKPCTCPATDKKTHANICCSQEMERVGAAGRQTAQEPAQPRH